MRSLPRKMEAPQSKVWSMPLPQHGKRAGAIFRLATIVSTLPLLSFAAEGPPPYPKPMNASEIQLGLQKLNVLGRVLYIAAHPDDENTNLIALWANGALYESAYLSVTRGDGGQNLIGPELREKLGLIRTEELLAARQIDHGQQFFTRAVDFGFSKTAEETLRIWDREKILSDIVWIMREFRPDVMVTRFSPEDQLTHGHHTASAILAREAFSAAGDAKRFPEQLELIKTWQPVRLVWNTSPFFFANRNIPFDPSGLTTMEAGGFNALLGEAYTEIAARSVSMHKSQGVGTPPRRGARKEYFKILAGKPMTSALFDGVDTTWARVPHSEDVAAKISRVITDYRPADPAASVPALLEARRALAQMADNDWAPQKRAELDQLMVACLGLHIEASTALAVVTPGQTLPIKIEAINRSDLKIELQEVRFPLSNELLQIKAPLPRDELVAKEITPTVPAGISHSQPYWLRQPGTLGTFAVDDQKLIGRPENPLHFPAEVVFKINGEELRFTLDTRYRMVDPVAGEVREALVIAPPAFANFANRVIVFPDTQPKSVQVKVTAASGPVQGNLRLAAPGGWSIKPASIPIDLKSAEGETLATFTVAPPEQVGEAKLNAVISTGGVDYSFSSVRISYPHIGVHVLMPPAEARMVRADVRKKGQLIGYIPGAGDDVPEALQQIGYTVKVLEGSEVNARNLGQFDAVVLGIRAYNTQERISSWVPQLVEYVKGGGVVVAQYNTTAELKTKEIGPYPLEISRDRVTEESAEVRILAPDHPIMTTPNKITAKDFEGWVQERGLYFPDKWDPAWIPILSCHDGKEKPLDGGLLVAKSGKGYFVYTGYAWFRQLPAGVPGAYRLFSNMVSLGVK